MKKILSIFISYLAIGAGWACQPIQDLKVGDAVWAQWTPQLWYHGRIEAECGRGFKIRFDAQDEKCSPVEEIAKDITPTRTGVQAGMAVLAPQGDGSYVRAQVLEERGWKYAVRYKDGSTGEFSLKELRVPHSTLHPAAKR
ncbi:MAG: hypothetical protein U1F66_10075 [bacterium]